MGIQTEHADKQTFAYSLVTYSVIIGFGMLEAVVLTVGELSSLWVLMI